MDLASAYKRIDQQQNSVKPRTTLAIKANASVLDVFKQAVNLIDSDKWLAGGPREIKREDYYCYLHFANDNDCIRAIKSKSKPQIHSVERTVTCNDIFQYKNKNGELDVYVRPAGGRNPLFSNLLIVMMHLEKQSDFLLLIFMVQILLLFQLQLMNVDMLFKIAIIINGCVFVIKCFRL